MSTYQPDPSGNQYEKNRKHTLNRRKAEFLRNLSIPNTTRLFEGHSPNKLSQVRGASNRAPTPESLKLDFANLIRVLIDTDLQFHDIAARRRAYEAGSNVPIAFCERSDWGILLAEFPAGLVWERVIGWIWMDKWDIPLRGLE